MKCRHGPKRSTYQIPYLLMPLWTSWGHLNFSNNPRGSTSPTFHFLPWLFAVRLSQLSQSDSFFLMNIFLSESMYHAMPLAQRWVHLDNNLIARFVLELCGVKPVLLRETHLSFLSESYRTMSNYYMCRRFGIPAKVEAFGVFLPGSFAEYE